jgi:hypothetical protein
MKKIILTLGLGAVIGFSYAQQPIAATDIPAVIDKLSKEVDNNYVFPDKGKQMGELVKKNSKAKKYSKISDPYALAAMLTDDLRSVANDKHLGVMYAPGMFEMMTKEPKPGSQPRSEFAAENNYSFMKAEVLEGNIGYLKFNGFAEEQGAMDVATGALNFLSNTDALIIDLRENGGGSPEMIRHICSYLFDQPVHLNSFYNRSNDKITESWTKAEVQGKKMTKQPVYVLMSNYTFSAAEEFAYDLQNLKRATIVGEVSGGGAHPVTTVPLANGFILGVPNERAINPITKTNWEGVGVKPDKETKASKALEEAHLLALMEVKKNAEPMQAKMLETLHTVKSIEYKKGFDSSKFSELAGTYGIRSITLEGEKLFFQRENGPKMPMLPLGQTEFVLDDYRTKISFVKDGNKLVLMLTRANGEVIKAEKNG